MMRAITLHQPYADLIAQGLKRFETRSWQLECSLPVELAIHAGKRWTKQEREVVNSLVRQFPEKLARYTHTPLETGAMLAITRVVKIWRVEDIREKLSALERAAGNYQDGRFAWQLELIEVLETPVPARGQQGIWNWERPEDES